jgi:ABC-type multidrug transport system ATPase subunit
MNYCIQTKDLSYRYSGTEQILDNVNIHVLNGSIYGFLGPNGAGKTTTLKLLLGLLRNQQGSIEIFGKEFHSNRIETLRQLGSLIETPSIYGHLTASENLEVFRLLYDVPVSRIYEVLKLVGLSHTGKKKAKAFSLGMKQRLSIAIALLHYPKLLVLDEPTNGLDPNGILEMRELLQKLNREEQITIIVSSHLLAEIEKLVTHVGIISKGKMAFEGTLTDLMKMQESSSVLEFGTSNSERTLEILQKHNIAAELHSNAVHSIMIPKEKIAEVNRALVAAGIDVYSIASTRSDLESIFMDITNEKTP